MGLKNKPSLLYDASVIRNERADYHNTAERVGKMVIDLVNAIDDSLIGIDDLIAAEVQKAVGNIDISPDVDVSGKLDASVFDSFFERVDLTSGGWYIKSKTHFVAGGESAAMGDCDQEWTPGGGSGGGASTLAGLGDVLLGSLEPGDVLKWNGKNWYNGTVQTGLDEDALAEYLQTNNYAKTSDIPSLAGYATQDWVNHQAYASQSWVTSQGYLTEHQDISHLLTRAEFEEMFVKVTRDDGSWYILTKSDFASCGESSAAGSADRPGSGGWVKTLNDLDGVNIAAPSVNDVLMFNGTEWINCQMPSGGLDESQLAAYLQQHNYVTSATLGNYVTVDTEQTITGKKTFGATETFFTRRATINGDFSGPENCPHIMWHVPNQQFTKMLMDVNGNLHLLWGGDTDLNNYRGLTVSSIARYGGTSSQFLKADGSVDSRSFLLNCGTLSGNIDSDYGEGIVTFDPIPSGTPPLSTPNITLLSMGPWGRRKMLAFPWNTDEIYLRRHNDSTMYGWTRLLSTHNYWEILNNVYLKIDGANATHAGTSAIARSLPEATGNVLDTTLFVTSDNNPAGNNNYNYYRRPATKIWNYILAKDGSGSGLDADLLDGRHGDSYLGCRYLGGQSDTHGAWVVLCPAYAGSLTNGGWFYGSVTITRGNAGAYNSKTEVLVQCGGQYNSNQGGYQVLYANVSISGLHVISYNGTRYIALGMDAASTMEFRVRGQWSGLEPFLIDSAASGLSYVSAVATTAYISTNAASATKLQTARTLYITSYDSYKAGDGVAFDGTGDITLKLPNSITASDWFRSFGTTGWYNQTYGGGIYMTDSVWVRTFNDKGFYCNKEIQSSETFNRTVYGGSSWNNGHGAYNVDIYNNANQTPLLLAYRNGAGMAATGANRLFAMELLNNGAQLNFGFGGAAKFYFYSGGNFAAVGDSAAGSDIRLKSNIEPLTNRGLLKPKRFMKNGQWCLGFIAQEVLPDYPELIRDMGGEDHLLSLCYGNVTAVLAVHVNELFEWREDQKKINENYGDRIKKLEERL